MFFRALSKLAKIDPMSNDNDFLYLSILLQENSKNDSDPVGLKALDEALACKDMQIKEESDSDLDSEEEDEDMDSNDGFLPVLTDSKLVDGEMLPVVKVKEEDDEDGEPLKEVAPHVVPPAKGIKINAGDNTYFIKELT